MAGAERELSGTNLGETIVPFSMNPHAPVPLMFSLFIPWIQQEADTFPGQQTSPIQSETVG